MKKELFIKIQAALEARISQCQSMIGGIETTEDLKKLTLAQAQQVQTFCKTELTAMNKIINTDLYHVIGMGDLAPTQMMQFTYRIREYLSYRSTLKALAMNLDKISSLPHIPTTAQYALLELGGITLRTCDGAVAPSGKAAFFMKDNQIFVREENYDTFIKDLSLVLKVNLSTSNFKTKVGQCGIYVGAKWEPTPEGALGTFTVEDNNFKKIVSYYNRICS